MSIYCEYCDLWVTENHVSTHLGDDCLYCKRLFFNLNKHNVYCKSRRLRRFKHLCSNACKLKEPENCSNGYKIFNQIQQADDCIQMYISSMQNVDSKLTPEGN